MCAVSRQAAFEQDEAVDGERLRRQAAAALEEVVHFARAAAFPAGKGDVRVERAALGFEADRLAPALDLGGERGERRFRLNPGP